MSKARGKYCCECEFWEVIGLANPGFVHEGRCTVPCDQDEPYKDAFNAPCDKYVRRKLKKVSYPRNGQFRYLCYMCKHWIHVLQGWDEGLCEVEKIGLVDAYEQSCCDFERRGNGKCK